MVKYYDTIKKREKEKRGEYYTYIVNNSKGREGRKEGRKEKNW